MEVGATQPRQVTGGSHQPKGIMGDHPEMCHHTAARPPHHIQIQGGLEKGEGRKEKAARAGSQQGLRPWLASFAKGPTRTTQGGGVRRPYVAVARIEETHIKFFKKGALIVGK